jgi:hypothetical protein
LNAESLDERLVSETLSTILKYEGDIRKAQEELKDFLRRAGERADLARAARAGKDLLH